jgi:hypothetical protein
VLKGAFLCLPMLRSFSEVLPQWLELLHQPNSRLLLNGLRAQYLLDAMEGELKYRKMVLLVLQWAEAGWCQLPGKKTRGQKV